MFAVTRSSLPSPFTSSIARPCGYGPVPKSVLTPKLPLPLPRNTETVAVAEPLVITRSDLPSPFRSRMTTVYGLLPVASWVTAKLPLPSPSSNEIVPA